MSAAESLMDCGDCGRRELHIFWRFIRLSYRHVRRDIAEQLRLDRPEILVGGFDRPNLIYRVRRRTNAARQIRNVLDRHAGESGIIYCIRRADVDEMTQTLTI